MHTSFLLSTVITIRDVYLNETTTRRSVNKREEKNNSTIRLFICMYEVGSVEVKIIQILKRHKKQATKSEQ